MTLTGEKQDLEMQVSSITAQLKTDKHRLTVAEGKVLKLESELEEKECQCTAYYNALEVRWFTSESGLKFESIFHNLLFLLQL